MNSSVGGFAGGSVWPLADIAYVRSDVSSGLKLTWPEGTATALLR
jgi:hypothetical protein